MFIVNRLYFLMKYSPGHDWIEMKCILQLHLLDFIFSKLGNASMASLHLMTEVSGVLS
jgi:hypothetical protein